MDKLELIGTNAKGLICIDILDSKNIIAKCLSCGREETYNKYAFKNEKVTCRNPECKNSKRVINWVGLKSKGLTCTREIDSKKIMARCSKCKMENEYSKSNFRAGKILCKNKRCSSSKSIDWNNFEKNNIRCIKKPENRIVIGKCNICGREEEYYNSAFSKGEVACRNKKCINSINSGNFKTDSEKFEITKIAKVNYETFYNFTCKQCEFNEYLTKEQCIKHLQGHKERN